LRGKKIVFISEECLDLNGRYLKCATELAEAGANVQTLVLTDSGRKDSPNWHYIRRPNWGVGELGSTLSYRVLKRRAQKFLKTQKYDAYHAMDYVSLDVAAHAKERLAGKIIFDACEIFTETAFSTPALKNYVQKIFDRSAQSIDAVLTPNTYLRDYYTKLCPHWPRAQIITNAPKFNLEQPYDGRMHRALGLESTEKILLYHGAFSALRGLQGLIDTASALPERHTLVLMGYGALEAELKIRAKHVNKEARRQVVQFLDPVPNNDLLLWISGAHYGLIPYENGPLNHSYCTPNKLYEYPAAGVPILATNLPTLSDIINRYNIGVIMDFPMTGSKIKLSVQKQERSLLAKGCESMALAEAWTANAVRLKQTYQSLLTKSVDA